MNIVSVKMVFLISLFSFSYTFGFSQVYTNAQTDSLIEGIKKSVLENYVITEKASRVSDSLSASQFYNVSPLDTLVKKINDELFKISDDKHLFLQYRPQVAENLLKHKDIHAEQNKKEKKEHYGFEKPEILEGNIGYLKLNYFADATHAKRRVISYIRKYKNTRALVIDLRNNFGGSGTMLQLLSGIFLPKDQKEILKINYKSGDIVTLKATEIKPGDRYPDHPICILISSQNFSAGEAFAFIMKNRGRATLIGETTAGAGNVAGPHPVYNQFVLTIPAGIIVDPVTNTGWEHVGVAPDIQTDSQHALEEAIALINKK